MRSLVRALGLVGLLCTPAFAQRAPASPVNVDRQGVLRWTADGREVALFGVNYAAPFAYDYQAMRSLGVDPKRAIDQDVAHLARLGLDAFRIHVWDREVSDQQGNLLANEHMDLFDYLLAQLAKRGIKSLLTPIAWWGPGYPAPDHASPGFANGFSKPRMLVDSVARRAQVRYVEQFVAHVNPYTGKSYRDDPDIIAFEIFNEPWHDLAPPPETTRFINELVASMRGTGLRKPIFYNVSEHYSDAHGQAVCAANIQGVSAQWYPTGLVRGAAMPGNPLPNVDRYPLPWAGFAGCANKARMVYEFDGADVTVPVMYPAMARAFRGAGFQWATQFAYDPLAIAHTNTEYQTHFLNLVYTPAKAISYLIAGEVFRRTPRGFDAGVYPASERFGKFRVSYAEQLSEFVSDSAFAYTGNTRTAPPAPAMLRRIAGVGSSPVVEYAGTGAYFLDWLADGVWRLEVYPDAVPVEDPHSRGSLRRTVTRVYHRSQAMHVALSDLGGGFAATALDDGNANNTTATDGRFVVRPGAYLLTRAGISRDGYTGDRRIGARALGEFFAPPSGDGPTVVRHAAPTSVTEGSSFALHASVAQATPPDSVLAFVRYAGWQGFRRGQRLDQADAYTYAAMVPIDTGRTGALEYVVTVFDGGKATTYPGATEGAPDRWDFTGTSHWTTRVVARGTPIVLFDANGDRAQVVGPGFMDGVRTRSDWIAGLAAERLAWLVGVEAFGPKAAHVAFRTMLLAPMRSRLAEIPEGSTGRATLRVRARVQGPTSVPVEVALMLSDGSAWGAEVSMGYTWTEIGIPVAQLKRVPLVLLPRPFPGFLPYDLTAGTTATAPDLRLIEGVQWGFRRAGGIAGPDVPVRVEIESVQLAWPNNR